MDDQDKEFEAFLQQFHLRKQGPFPAEVAVPNASRRTGRRWLLVAAAAVAISISLVRYFSVPDSPSAFVRVAGDSAYKAGEKIVSGDPIRAGGFETLVIDLQDGTRIEMRAQSEAVLEAADDGTRIRLNNGSILVSAAKQRDGHFYVEARDLVASVVGTVFLVEAQPTGARVGVLEGEVEVRRRLVQGQEISTVPEAPTREASPPSVSRRIQTPPSQEQPKQEPQQQPQPEQPPAAPQENPRPPDTGADSPGRQIFYRACVACHSDEFVKRQWPSREAVANRVAVDIQIGAAVTPAEVPVLIDYIWRTYGVIRYR
jgi:hypothetical protein